MIDIITIDECMQRLDTIHYEIVPDDRKHFAPSSGIVARRGMAIDKEDKDE